jgi:putative redox protein
MQLVKFRGSTGHTLAGWLHSPESSPRGALILSHCFTCTKDLILYRHLAQGLANDGFYLLRFDFTGLGQSEGNFAETTLQTNIGDIYRAIDELHSTIRTLPLGLIGHSLGGTAAILSAMELPAVKALVVIAAPPDPSELKRLLANQPQRPSLTADAIRVKIGGRFFTIKQSFFESISRINLLESVNQLGRPLLIIHGTEDSILNIKQSEMLFSAAAQPKGFEPITGGDHLLAQSQQMDSVRKIISLWFERHL